MSNQHGLPDFVRAPNQGLDPELYEIENQALDRGNLVWDALAALAPWAGKSIMDLGCGTGFWLPRYAHSAHTVIGVEPDTSLLAAARARTGAAMVLHGSAEHLPLADGRVDVIHARFAYFFPSASNDCTAGLAEALRVLRSGGSLIVIDNDHHHGQFAALLARSSWAESQGPRRVHPAVVGRCRRPTPRGDEQLAVSDSRGAGPGAVHGVRARGRGTMAAAKSEAHRIVLRVRAVSPAPGRLATGCAGFPRRATSQDLTECKTPRGPST